MRRLYRGWRLLTLTGVGLLAAATVSLAVRAGDRGVEPMSVRPASSGPERAQQAPGAVGTTGGRPVPGRAGPLRFNGITGVGKDSTGKLYVMQDHPTSQSAGTGTNIDVYSGGPGRWARSWQLLGLEFVDMADVDTSTYSNGVVDAYTADEHFRIDLTKPAEQRWTWVGQQTDRFGNPGDGRLLPFGEGQRYVPHVVTLGGIRFLAIVGVYGDAIHFYTWGSGTELTREVATLSTGYIDSTIDSNGTVWWAEKTSVRSQKFTGLNGNGAPTFGAEQKIPMPAPFNQLGRVRYDAARDVMFIAGFTSSRPTWATADKVMGTVLARYDSWSTGIRKAAWTTVLPYNPGAGVDSNTHLGLVAMDIAGNGHIYASMLNGFPGERQQRTYDYSQATGALVRYWLPGPVAGPTGWIDLLDGVRSVTLPSGQTLVFQEDDYRAKVLMYRVLS